MHIFKSCNWGKLYDFPNIFNSEIVVYFAY